MSQPAFVAWAETAIERDITAELQRQLVKLLNTGEVRGFSTAMFAPPVRGQEVENHSGSEKEKRPDLTFHRLAARPVDTQNAQFYECKIVGRGRTLNDYHDNGVMRFVDGRYAWAMPHAGMIAYVSPPPPAAAIAALDGYWTAARSSAQMEGLPTNQLEVDMSIGQAVAISVHQRTFMLPGQSLPAEIVLRHMWLSAAA
ncbi:hypothetical protein IP84_17300 [beta proteobacterium AAP99]|nr:hypothetical protein IP84_17300 [beta proteobacterium AAP99]